MNAKTWSYQTTLAIALGGLALVCAGLWLAALSNPARFDGNVRNDKFIDLFAGSGLVCTIAGMGIFLFAVKHMPLSMTPEKRQKTNTAVGMGFVFQLAGLTMIASWPGQVAMGWLLVLASLPLFIIGAMYYAEAKGYTRQLGLLGLLGPLGLLVLILLPKRDYQDDRSMRQTRAD